MNARLLGKTRPQLVIPELQVPKFSEYSNLRDNAERMMQEVLAVVDSLRELQKDSAVLSGVFALLNDAVIRLSDSGTVTDINPSAERMFGIEYRQAVGASIERLLGIPFAKITERSHDQTFESRLPRVGADFFDASISVTCIRHLSKHDGTEYVMVVRDISDLLKMKRALSETDVKFEALFKALDEASDVIIITNKQNEIIFVNRSFTRYTGYTFEDALGKNPGFYRSGDLPHSFYEELWQHLSQRKVWQGTLINKHKSGNLLYDRTVITPVMNGDPTRPSYYIAVKQIGESNVLPDSRQMQLRFKETK